jgi:hypothetical protein
VAPLVSSIGWCAKIESDLGGRRQLTRIEGELVRAFAGAATTLQYLNHQVMLGEISELPSSQHHAATAV